MKITRKEILSRLPNKLVDRLMSFQKEGVEYAVNKNGRCLIADEMGLGKTLQAISVAYYYRDEWPLLIIVPSSLRYCWIEEFEKWLPDINPREINLIQSGNDASGIGKASVTITTFGLLSNAHSTVVREALFSQGFQVVIVDESHYIRNAKTVSAKTVVPLIKNANRKILLSGTPALARPVELYPQIDAICPNMFGSWWAYTARYCDAKTEWIGKMKRRNVNGASNLEELQQKLSSMLMIRREKMDVLTQLPPKQRQKVLFELKDSDLKKEIRKTFEELRPLMKKKSPETFEVLTGAGEHDVKDTNMLSLISKLYQLSGEAKIGPAKEYVEMLCENPKLKFLVFAYHHSMMNGLSQSLYDKKVKFIRIDGDTPPSERPQLVHQFQSDPDTRVAVLSILAAGVGLTLTSATVVVFAEMYWTPGVMIQCEDRAHRIGQTSCVAVHYLVAKDTMDEWVWSSVCKKTIVTSTTLTGKKQEMAADVGDKYQVDVLSNADMWVPTTNEELDVTDYLQTHQDSNQKSILQFFSPSQMAARKTNLQATSTIHSSSQQSYLDRLDQDMPTPLSRKHEFHSNPTKRPRLENTEHKMDKSTPSKLGLIVIDSGSDNEDFADETKSKKSTQNSLKKANGSNSRKRKRLDKRKSLANKISPKCNLVSIFAKSRNCGESDNSIVLSDTDEDITDNDDKQTAPSKTKSKAFVEMNNKNSEVKTSTSVESMTQGSSTIKGCKNGLSSSTTTSDNTWSCMACTYLNHKDIHYCEICDTPKKLKQVKNSTVRDPQMQRGKSGTNEIASVNKTTLSPDLSSKTIVKASEIENYSIQTDSASNIEGLLDNGNAINEYESDNEAVIDDNNSNEDDPDNYHIDYVPSPDDMMEQESPFPGSDTDVPERTTKDIIDTTHLNKEETLAFSNKGISEIGHVNIGNDKEKDLLENLENKSRGDLNEINILENKENELVTKTVLTESCYFKKNTNSLADKETTKDQPIRKEVQIQNKFTMASKLCLTENSKTKDDNTLPDTCMSPTNSMKKYRFKSLKRNSLSTETVDNPSRQDDKQMSGVIKETTMSSSKEASQNEKARLAEPDIKITKATMLGHKADDKKTDQDIEKKNGVGVTPGKKVADIGANHDDMFSSPEMEQFYNDDLINGENGGTKEGVTEPDARVVNLDSIPTYSVFKYTCSKYTGRIFLYNKDEEALNVNFVPMDVEVENSEALPDLLLHPHNLRIVQKFVREWQSLTETKRRLIVKAGDVFISPLLEYDKLRSCKTINVQRHKTKMDTTQAAIKKATEVNGSVRVISKTTGIKGQTEDGDRGVTQALSEDGTPLCVQCFKPYESHLVQRSSILKEENAWQTRFCSQKCSEDYWMVTNNDYMRDKVYEAEHGVCQLCHFDVHALFKQIRDTKDLQKRAELITKSKLSSLTVKTKQLIVKKPVAGQFWHADHIVPVWEGGGQCDIDNLRTLCVICHHKVTAKQASKRATVRKLGAAVNSGDISAFFQRM